VTTSPPPASHDTFKAKIPRSYPFPDEEGKKLVDLMLKKLGELAPTRGGADAGLMSVPKARSMLGRKSKNMTDADVKGLLELARENHLDLYGALFFDRNPYSRMPLVPTPARLKLSHACDQYHSSRASTSYRYHCNPRPNTEGMI
jgi:hypothetical protein